MNMPVAVLYNSTDITTDTSPVQERTEVACMQQRLEQQADLESVSLTSTAGGRLRLNGLFLQSPLQGHDRTSHKRCDVRFKQPSAQQNVSLWEYRGSRMQLQTCNTFHHFVVKTGSVRTIMKANDTEIAATRQLP